MPEVVMAESCHRGWGGKQPPNLLYESLAFPYGNQSITGAHRDGLECFEWAGGGGMACA
jgi:hypothetical protein